jgi:hypothetical protein
MNTAEERIKEALHQLRDVIEDYNNDGDWYGCVQNAIPYLREALRSGPPGSAVRQPDRDYRKKP